ncbi:unnamed protein product [Rodentolepis nana]|uniref:Cytochrome P450 n=1 Tax=Rodentolepis nana TaxID=102285 RepID=A0A158QJI3_RODNA|nr:unnamed protein product [Rodentolepis nana]
MTTIPAKEHKLLRATYLIRNALSKPSALSKHLLEPFERILTAEDQLFLNNFLENNDLKNILLLIDTITRLTQSVPGSPNSKITTNLRPLISKLRPEKGVDRNCLVALNDTWNEIEGLLTKSPGQQYPDAQELYDILSDEFIRMSQHSITSNSKLDTNSGNVLSDIGLKSLNRHFVDGLFIVSTYFAAKI